MSPEQAIGDAEPDGRSDIYSLGAVAYYLLTGSPPFESDKPIKVIIAHASQEVVPPRSLRPTFRPTSKRSCCGCLAKVPADRYQDAWRAWPRPCAECSRGRPVGPRASRRLVAKRADPTSLGRGSRSRGHGLRGVSSSKVAHG